MFVYENKENFMTTNQINNSFIRKRLGNILAKKEDNMQNSIAKDEHIIEEFQNKLKNERLNSSFDIMKIKKEFIDFVMNDEYWKKSPNFKFIFDSSKYLVGLHALKANVDKILNYPDVEKYFVENAFISTIGTSSSIIDIPFEHAPIGYILDDLTLYYDATRPSRIEQVLNSELELSDEQIKRAKNVIEKIISNKITKYNNQPIYQPQIGKNKKKVLVIDQSYRDFSISKGLANDDTFKIMLDTAIIENPDSDIIIKTHPDAIGQLSRRPKCYYQNVQEDENIYKITDFINPISLIEYVDKVYVCSSQFGFEALMAGKEVHTFGMPFYANWGLTTDAKICERRTRCRTLEEVFYIAYIMFSVYYNPELERECEIEEAIDFMIKYRNMYLEKCYGGK